MKKRILCLAVLCIALLLALTGCSNAGNAVSNAASKVGEDVSNAMSRVESFFEGDDVSGTLGDDALSSHWNDDASSGMLDEDFGVSSAVDDDLNSGSSVTTEDTP